jgi:hypothetical protein
MAKCSELPKSAIGAAPSALLLVLTLSGCGGSGGGAGPLIDMGNDASTDAAGGNDVAASGDGATGMFTNDSGSGPPAGCVPCSADLHDVIDCTTHQVLKTCPSDTGCDPNGQCVAPCDSAADNRSSVGCDYYVINPDAFAPNTDSPTPSGSLAGSCFAAFVANTWTSSVTLSGEFDGQSLNLGQSAYLPQGSGASLQYTPLPSGTLAPNQVAIVFLAQYSPSNGTARQLCPPGVHAAYTSGDAAIHGTGRGHAFELKASAPVVAFDIYPYGGASSVLTGATLLLPTSVWDTNYVGVTAYAAEPSNNHADENITFVASQPDTTITINPVSAIGGGPGVAATGQGVPVQYVLDVGESLQLSQLAELSGSAILADKPIGVWGGHWGMSIPNSGTFVPNTDSAHQQLPPVRALGSEYAAVRYRNRVPGGTEESVPWRIAGAVNGTTLQYDPSPPSGAPSTLSQGQVVEFDSATPFIVSSQDGQHPFYFAGHMTGGSLANGLGDPETVNVIPPAQFLDHYVFFTDPTYAETNLVVVRAQGTAQDVTLDCLGTLTGWQPVGTRYEYTRVDVQHQAKPVGACDNGGHEMQSGAPFGVTVWGFDSYVSYAYPAGAGVRSINTVVVQPVVPK